MRRAPIRLRLTAFYVLVLAGVLVALGAFVVTRLRADLTSEVDRTLRGAASQIAHGYGVEGGPEFRDVARTVLPGPRGEAAGAQILDPAGRVVLAAGAPVARAPLVGPDVLHRALGGATIATSRRVASPAAHLRVVARPTSRAGRRGVLVVAESLEEVDDAVHRVLVLLGVGSAAALALAGLGGWLIARAALRPVEQMTTRADRIGVDDLSQRLTVPRAQDEVGHLARTLNAMLARLESGVESRQRLVADASHELRAPLTAMRSELDVSLRHDELDPTARAVLASARDEVVRMARVVDDLLTLARVDAGRLDLLVAPADLGGVAERAVRAQRAAAEAAGVVVTVTGEAEVAAADGDRLEQVVGNLVDNAIRVSPRGGEVAVEVWADDVGGRAGFTVSDDGPGVPPEARERIFERFSREDAARGRGGGAGLGLAICREIVRAHGGRITVESRSPRGSAFAVALPRGRPERRDAPVAAPA